MSDRQWSSSSFSNTGKENWDMAAVSIEGLNVRGYAGKEENKESIKNEVKANRACNDFLSVCA